ncbi:MAG: PAS domain S-box protein [Planctomycetes bacterium]|nr:PAS domain S-box protein [Planctomycetota bacterium]
MLDETRADSPSLLKSMAGRFTDLSLRWQISAFTCLAVLASLIVLGWIAFSQAASLLTTMTLEQLATETSAAASRIEQTVDNTRVDVRETPHFPPIPGIIRSEDNGGDDPDQTGSTTRDWITRLATIVSAQMEQRRERLWTAVIDSTGKELMRVDWQNGKPTLATVAAPNASQDDFFQTAIRLPRDTVAISRTERLNGHQVFRTATPYFDPAGKPRGIFLSAVDSDAVLKTAVSLTRRASIEVVDENGTWLLSEETPENVLSSTRYSDVKPVRGAEMTRPGSPNTYKEVIDGSLRPDGISLMGTYQKLFYDKADPSRFWAVCSDIPASKALSPVSGLARQFWIYGLVIIVVATACSLLGAIGLTSALGVVTTTANEIAAGDLDAEMPAVRPLGEVRTLAEAVRSMTGRLRETLAASQRQEQRTAAILNSTADSILTLDENGTILTANTTAGSLFRSSAEDLVGANAGRFVPALTSSGSQQDHSILAEGEVRMLGGESEVQGVRTDGSKVAIAMRVAEMDYSGQRLFIATLQDVSRRHQIEEERHRIFEAVRAAVKRLASASAEILAQTTQQAATAQQQATSVTQTTATVKEISATATESRNRAEEVAGSARRADEVSRSGREAVEETSSAMSQVQEQTEQTAQNILTLAERAQVIGDLITTVNEIADQTNLLALNAAIEASRAGEHGKGFAVVASEVKALAEQSRKATDQVRQILGEIQQATNTAVMSTEQGTRSVESAQQVVGHASQTISELAQTISEAARAAQQIVASSGQQATGMEQIRDAMSQIDVSTRQSLSATQQSEESARDLAALGQELQQLIEESMRQEEQHG